MYARINEFTTSGDITQAVAEWRRLIEQQPGFKGFLSLKRDENRHTVITLWESEQANEGWRSNPDFQAWVQRVGDQMRDWTNSGAQVDAANADGISI
jgi:heme-degrading monooxygenase HmoA